MRVPVTTPQTNNNINNNQSPNPKPETNLGFHTPSRINPNLCYEPTSVLDLRHSPSPVAADKPSKVSPISDVLTHHDQPLEWDEQVDWDSIMRDLGLHDDSVPNLKATTTTNTHLNHHHNSEPQIHHLPEYPHPQPFDPTQLVHSDFSLSEVYSSQNFSHHNLTSYDQTDTHPSLNSNVGFDFIEELIRAADCFDSDELNLAQVILDRLNQRQRLISPNSKPVGKPLQRAAVYFKDALQSLLNTSTGSSPVRNLSSWSEIVQTIRAYKGFSGISPIPMFSHFTTNQALLEALNGSSFIHVIDFDIGLGGQYASLMKELAEKADVSRTNPPVLRITAVVPEEYAVESRLVRENLSQFAQELRIRFQIDFLLVRTFEILSFKAVKFMDGEKTAVLLSPYIMRRLGAADNVGAFLGDMRRVSPSVVVFVDGEGMAESGATSFRRNFVSGLEFFSIMMESLDAAVPGGEMVRKIEAFLLRPKIEAAVEAAGRRVPPWREVFHGAGMRAVELSQFADFQAQCLLGKVQVRGFHVAKRQAELVLCWHDRALVATSAWRC
ncbi:PREDICTED: scarecrow-like protein 15 [Fragaria vesca subsp. vesca]|uniref:scarecrow-like protein 15 n=1 Tax=Fragaria vesca subsp. vesca TaxID=101020 RepID=UPI0002C34ECF|nr:PREDICTED: scarecrow-like protein 15 [Fragaria vesca subsp. vesca]